MGEELFAACTAIYDGRGSNSDLNVLLGVACMDVNMVVGLDTLQTRSDYDDFLGRVNEVSEGGCDLFTSFEGEALNTALEKVRWRLEDDGAVTCNATRADNTSSASGVLLIPIWAIVIIVVSLVCAGGAFFLNRRTKPYPRIFWNRPPTASNSQAPPIVVHSHRPTAPAALAPPAYAHIGMAPAPVAVGRPVVYNGSDVVQSGDVVSPGTQ